MVVASDHGRGLGAHDEETHGIFLYDETIHVPLLLKLPQNQSAGKRVSARASPGGRCSHHPCHRGRARPVADAGTVLVANLEDQYRSTGLLGQRFSATAHSDGARWNPGVRANIYTSRRPSRSSTISRPTPAPRATWRRLPKPRSKPSPASWMPSTGASAAPAPLEALNLLPAKCRSWPRWDMSACRNRRLPQRRGDGCGS